jgi:hypothetical protein
MDAFLKIAIPIAVLIVGGLLALVLLAPPVQRSTFLVEEPAALNQELLVEDLRGLEGVYGMRLEEGGRLVVDHCPQLGRNRLVGMLDSRDGMGAFQGSRRIMPIQTLAFPVEQGGGLTAGRGCQPKHSCTAGSSWKELLGSWRR